MEPLFPKEDPVNDIVEKLPLVARVLLGLVFLVFGLNGFLGFMDMPEMPPQANAFLGALVGTGYFLPVQKAVEVLGGLALLSGRFVPLGLTLLAPVVVEVALFHVFLAPGGLGMALVLLVLEAFLAYAYRDSFRGVLDPKARPRVAESREAQARRLDAEAPAGA